MVIDLYIETTTDGYKPANAASNHMKNINGKNTFGEINLKGPGAEGEISSVGLSFTFKNRDTNAEVTIPWMQFTLFDFDQNYNDGNRGQEGRPPHHHHIPCEPSPPTCTHGGCVTRTAVRDSHGIRGLRGLQRAGRRLS